MKTSKKILALSLAACMTVPFFTACGDNSTSGDAASTGASFKIGGIGPITGGAAVYGQAVKNAAEMAVEEINAAGGINGYQIDFKFEDDVHDAEKSVNAYNTLKDWGMRDAHGYRYFYSLPGSS